MSIKPGYEPITVVVKARAVTNLVDLNGGDGPAYTLQCDGAGNLYVAVGGFSPSGGGFAQASIVGWSEDDLDPTTHNALAADALAMGWNPIGDTIGRITAGPADATPIAEADTNGLDVRALQYVYDSSAGEWIPEAPATGALQWTATNAPAVNTQATAARAAPGAGQRNVIQAITASLTGSAASTADIRLRVRDGAGGTILFEHAMAISSLTGASQLFLSGLNIPCSENTAAVIEFSAAGGANTYQSVAMQGIARAI